MSLRSPSSSSPAQDQRVLLKRKHDDFSALLDDDEELELSELFSVRMRKDDTSATRDSSKGSGGGGAGRGGGGDVGVTDFPTSSGFNQISYRHEARPFCYILDWLKPDYSTRLQFFVRLISPGNTVVVRAHSDETVGFLKERLYIITRIPVDEQRLIYEGKELEGHKSLADCSIRNDSGLNMVARIRSTIHPKAWKSINDMISMILQCCNGEEEDKAVPEFIPSIKIMQCMYDFLSHLQQSDPEYQLEYMNIFLAASAPTAFVKLYNSPIEGNHDAASKCIKFFLSSSKQTLGKKLFPKCAPVLVEFCNLLRQLSTEDPLYLHCRYLLGLSLTNTTWKNGLLIFEEDTSSTNLNEKLPSVVLQDLFPFVSVLGTKLSTDLGLSMEFTASIGPLSHDVRDFAAFLVPFRQAIVKNVDAYTNYLMPSRIVLSHTCRGKERGLLRIIFVDLLCKMDKCLQKMQDHSFVKSSNVHSESSRTVWSQYLVILKELHLISELYQGAEELFWEVLKKRKASLCFLIVTYARRTDDNQWLLKHKEATNFECRRHLIMMLLPEVREEYDDVHEMLIERSQLLSESFEYIARADPESLRGGLFLEFKNEEATGPGVLREWFISVCQAIFSQQNPLFETCSSDHRRFFPNPSSKVDPLHLDYFTFSGRVIALALMHRVQVGVVFDRVFFLQLAGVHLCVEDIREADPALYSSCKQLLEMDAEFIDSDALGLTFVREVDELGSRKSVELCPDGKNTVVNSKNREKYVDLLIQHRFVTSIEQQVTHFAQGFADILAGDSTKRSFFFQSLELQDLDGMLCGTESTISDDDWKEHTNYVGYTETDPQILWFWKIVEEMPEEQKRVLLFFWTSIKYLPVEGFCGLASRLYIYKSTEAHDHLPSSHTCFYRLCFPPYRSMQVMKDRLCIITQEHVGMSFGTW